MISAVPIAANHLGPNGAAVIGTVLASNMTLKVLSLDRMCCVDAHELVPFAVWHCAFFCVCIVLSSIESVQ